MTLVLSQARIWIKSKAFKRRFSLNTLKRLKATKEEYLFQEKRKMRDEEELLRFQGCNVVLKEKDKLQNEILNKKKTLIYKKKLQQIYIVTNNENTLALAHTHKLSHQVNIDLTNVRTTDTK